MTIEESEERMKKRITELSIYILRTGASPQMWLAIIDALVETAVEHGRQLEKEKGVQS